MFDYIEMFYNPKRKHTNNGMLSPVDFETRQQKLNEAGVLESRGYSVKGGTSAIGVEPKANCAVVRTNLRAILPQGDGAQLPKAGLVCAKIQRCYLFRPIFATNEIASTGWVGSQTNSAFA